MRLYPVAFRSRFGDEMLQNLRDLEVSGERIGWVHLFGDLCGSALTQRWEMKNMQSNWWLVPFGAALAFGVAFMVTGLSFGVGVFLVLLAELAIALAIGGAAVLIGRRARGAEHDYSERRLRWWWIPAGAIGLAEVSMVSVQLLREPKGTHLFAFAIISSFAALVFGGLLLRNRRRGNIMIALGVAPVMTLFWSVILPIVSLVVIVMALSDNVRMSRRPRAAV